VRSIKHAVTVACSLFTAAVSLAQTPGGTELFRFQSPSGADNALRIIVNREGQIATGVSLYIGDLDDFMLFYQPGGSVTTSVIPNGGTLNSFSFSNGGAVATVIESGLPWKVYHSSFGAPLEQIFVGTRNGTNSTPVISDSGVVYFSARENIDRGSSDFWSWSQEGSLIKLPDPGEYSLGETLYVDSNNRYYVPYSLTDSSTNVDLHRYSPVTGAWENLTSLSGPKNVPLLGGDNAKAINAQGDMIFPIDDSNSYSLNLYSQSSGNITTITDFNLPWLGGFNLPRRAEVELADTGEILAVIGGGDAVLDQTTDILYLLPDGSSIDLADLLPEGQSFGVYPKYPEILMSHEGKLLIPTIDDVTGRWSYFYFDHKRDLFRSIAELQQLQLPVMQAAISDDGHVYYWYEEGAETVLRTVAVPETGSFIAVGLLMILSSAGYATRRIYCSIASSWLK